MVPKLYAKNFLTIIFYGFLKLPSDPAQSTQKTWGKSVIYSQFQEPSHMLFPHNKYTENKV